MRIDMDKTRWRIKSSIFSTREPKPQDLTIDNVERIFASSPAKCQGTSLDAGMPDEESICIFPLALTRQKLIMFCVQCTSIATVTRLSQCVYWAAPDHERQTTALTVIRWVESADVANAANPLIHLLLCVSDQVEDPVDGLDVEYEAVLQILLVERQPSIHLQGQQTWF